MATELTLPKQWEDWVSLALGVWLCASPWLLQFVGGDMIVTQNAFLVGLLLIITEFLTLTVFRVWEEWINVVLGAWLVVSPWVLGITALAPTADFIIVGSLVLALAFYEIWDVRHHLGHPA